MKKISIFILLLTVMALPLFAGSTANAGTFSFTGTFWALVPPLVAIVLALITKEVFFSLFTGIVLGDFLPGISPSSNPWMLLSKMDLLRR